MLNEWHIYTLNNIAAKEKQNNLEPYLGWPTSLVSMISVKYIPIPTGGERPTIDVCINTPPHLPGVRQYDTLTKTRKAAVTARSHPAEHAGETGTCYVYRMYKSVVLRKHASVARWLNHRVMGWQVLGSQLGTGRNGATIIQTKQPSMVQKSEGRNTEP